MWLTFVFIAIFAVNCEGVEKNKGIQNLIFGGSNRNVVDAPYFAIFLVSNSPVCGASIVSDEILLTAAHCYFPKYKHSVVVGTDVVKGGTAFDVEKIVLHPQYNSSHFHNDIAVVKILGRFFYGDKIFPIQLAPRDIDLKLGDMLTTMGFGQTEAKKQASLLLSVDIPYVQKDVCEKLLPDITDGVLCAGGDVGYDSCLGDSGGPLVYKNLLVGLVSFSYGDCGLELPAGYTRISAMRDFIDTTIKQLVKETDKH